MRMTPFMVAVAEAYQGKPVEAPRTVQSRPRPTGVGTDRHVAVRSLAEQLVCETNAVLAGSGELVELEDRPGVGELAFSMRVRGREARISTRYADGVTRGRLWWPEAATPRGEARELAGAEDVGNLILRLLRVAAAPDVRGATRQGGS